MKRLIAICLCVLLISACEKAKQPTTAAPVPLKNKYITQNITVNKPPKDIIDHAAKGLEVAAYLAIICGLFGNYQNYVAVPVLIASLGYAGYEWYFTDDKDKETAMVDVSGNTTVTNTTKVQR